MLWPYILIGLLVAAGVAAIVAVLVARAKDVPHLNPYNGGTPDDE